MLQRKSACSLCLVLLYKSSGTQGKQIHKAVWTSVLLSSLCLPSNSVIPGQMLGCDVQGREGEQRDPAALEREERAAAAAPALSPPCCATDWGALAWSQRLKGGGDSRGDSRGDASTPTGERGTHLKPGFWCSQGDFFKCRSCTQVMGSP